MKPQYINLDPLIEPEDRILVAPFAYRLGQHGDPFVSFAIRRQYIENYSQKDTPWLHARHLGALTRFLPLIAENLQAQAEKLKKG